MSSNLAKPMMDRGSADLPPVRNHVSAPLPTAMWVGSVSPRPFRRVIQGSSLDFGRGFGGVRVTCSSTPDTASQAAVDDYSKLHEPKEYRKG